MKFRLWIPSNLLGLMLLGALLVSPVHADKIEFGEGNVLFGTVVSMEDGKLKFATSHFETVDISVDAIRSLTTDNAVTVKLTNDSILTGLITMEDGHITIRMEIPEETVSLNWGQIKYINEPPGKWTGNVSLGGTVQTGNTERTSISFAGETKREWEYDRFLFRIQSNYAEDDGRVSSRNTYGEMKFDHFFSQSLFSALSLEMLNDKFKNLNLRTIVGLGLGYRIWNDDIKSLEFVGGITYFSEDVNVGEDDRSITGRLAGNFVYHFTSSLLFKDGVLFYPSFKNSGEYRMRNEASLINSLGGSWALKLTHIIDQNTEPAPDVKEVDQLWIFSLQYDF